MLKNQAIAGIREENLNEKSLEREAAKNWQL